jgi:nucleotide-binding universal stress UspA family protein
VSDAPAVLVDPILLVVDGRPGFEHTRDEASRLARACGLELTLFQPVTESGEGAAELVELVLHAVLAQPISLVALHGGSETRLKELLLGGTAARLLRDCSRPVWLSGPRPSKRLKRLLVAVDTSRAAGEAFRLSLALARLLDARLELLRVYPESESRARSYPHQQRELRDYAARFELGGLELEYLTWEGEAGQRIVEAAAARRSDLLVLGSAGRRGMQRWLRQPMVERVAGAAPCSLLCVPASSP